MCTPSKDSGEGTGATILNLRQDLGIYVYGGRAVTSAGTWWLSFLPFENVSLEGQGAMDRQAEGAKMKIQKEREMRE